MGIRESLDISAYLVAGPENCKDRPFGKVVRQAVDAGFTCVQVRAKDCSARQIMDCVREAEQAIASAGKQDR
ncbi:MAG: thiamine phosphate synthase, partial [Eggerthellaceae bacterium]|nr:thiamine phosphate synthase [Eggerthellaceae bacterium]